MQGDDSSNNESLSVPSDTTTPPEGRDNGAFAAELRDLELRLEQLELEQRSLRIQLQRARLRHAEPTATLPTPSSTPPQQREPSVRPSPTPGRPVSSGVPSGRRNNPYLRPLATATARDPTTPSLEPYTSGPLPPQRAEVPDRTPQAGDRLDAAGQHRRQPREQTSQAGQSRWPHRVVHFPMFPAWRNPPRHWSHFLPYTGSKSSH